ncbi:MAG: hypothetical protein IK043_02170 [Candidatus Methanomethylophilaceae archaeon]|nr:hypothetical protein [Candidatus Methanomethylophilaceae archaeon]
MGLRLAICQYASTDDVDTNLDRIRNAVGSLDADLFLFPELFLTRYGSGLFDTKDAEEVLTGISKERMSPSQWACPSGKGTVSSTPWHCSFPTGP